MSKVEITAVLLEFLKGRAQAATPGPWASWILGGPLLGGDYQVRSNTDPDEDFVCRHVESAANANYIAAASPDVVVALIERIEELEARLSEKRVKAFLEMVDRIPLKLQDRLGEYEKIILRLGKEADWLAKKLFDFCYTNGCENTCAGKVTRCPRLKYRLCPVDGCINSWREAARKAVEGQS